MIWYSRGGAVARCAYRLAPILLAGMVTSGCSKLHPVTPRYSVNIKSLMILHPSWAQVVSMQRTLDGLSKFEPYTNVSPLAPTAGNTVFALPAASPKSVVIQRQKPIADYVMRYLRQKAAIIRLRNKRRIAREELIEARNTLIQIAAARKRLQLSLTSEHLLKANELARELTRLGYRDIALQSQIRAYSGQSLKDALLQRQIIQAQIATKSEEQGQLLGDVLPAVEKMLTPQKIALEQKSRERIDALRTSLDIAADKLEQAASSHNNSAVQDLMPDGESIPIIGTGQSIAPLRQALPLNISLQNPDPAKMRNSSELARNAVDHERTVWENRRNMLAAVIEQDVRQSVEQIAQKHQWKLVSEGAPHSTDRTSVIAIELQKEWNTAPALKTP